MGGTCTKAENVDGEEGLPCQGELQPYVELDVFNNIVILTDSYKVTHHLQYPPKTETIYSYFESRGGLFDQICFFGLQYFLKRYLVGQVVTKQKIDQAESYFRQHFNHPAYGYNDQLFNREGWEYILTEHNGRLPVAIKALPEGTVLPVKNVLFTLVNTDPKCYWLTNYLESLLVQVWYPTTVCTQGREIKQVIKKYLADTGCEDLTLFSLHDFGFRGVSSVESAAIGSAAHMVNFLSSGTLPGLMFAREYYCEKGAGRSFPASEHSTVVSWGKEHELEAYMRMLEQHPKGTLSCVVDSYDTFASLEQFWGAALRDRVEKRQGTLLIRTDSGQLPGTMLQVLEKLGQKFGTSETATGHKRLPDCVRVFQSDGIDINSLEACLKALKKDGWAANNVVFGSGGAVLQKLHRDTQRCAFKCSWAKVAGEGRPVMKDPITDKGKASKEGKLTLELRDGEYITVVQGEGDIQNDVLREVFRDGKLLIEDTFRAVRQRSEGKEEKVEPLATPLDAAGELDPFGNILMLTDAYKVGHHMQYPEGTEVVYSYFESRGGSYEEVCFFGLQYFIKKFLMGQVVTPEAIEQADDYFRTAFKDREHGYDERLFNRKGWELIVSEHGGHLPVVIKAVPEGTVLRYQNVLFTVENTDPRCFWLTSYLESLLVQVWYATTVCTQSREQKKLIMRYLVETGSTDAPDKGLHLFKLHDFGFRGASSAESAAVGGAAHLVNFPVGDTLPALVMLREYYNADCAGFSIPASEHSTITSWGRERELDSFRNMLEQYPNGPVACVSDSYDIFNACEQFWGTDLKDAITARNGTLIVRPDSGELPKTLLQVLEKLEAKFGSTQTSTGHKLLPECIRVIQGDGIDIRSLEKILQALKDEHWAVENVVFGSGGALLQKVHRDVLKFAFKCSHVVVKGEARDVYKDPATDPSKRSKKGRLTLEKQDGQWVTISEGKGDPEKDQLREIFRNGKIVVDDSLEAIRKRAAIA